MATTFRVHVRGWETKRARQMAQEAFREIARLETILSRYVPGSDIDQLNLAPPGEMVRLNADAFACLRMALEVAAFTEGAFDPTIGMATGDPRVTTQSAGPAATSYLDVTLDQATMSACRHHDGVRLDLGGIGKGYALDRAAELLLEWEAPSALLDAGGSTVLAIAAQPEAASWVARLECAERCFCCDVGPQALASSGIMEKGAHIVDPRTGLPTTDRHRVWAMAPSAAQADALSTAFFVLTEQSITSLCRNSTSIGAAWDSKTQDGLIECGAIRCRAEHAAGRITRLA